MHTLFKCNPTQIAMEDKVVNAPSDIKNTDHLARCLQAPLCDPGFNNLANKVIEIFEKKADKSLDLWREVIPFVATEIGNPYLIDKAYTVLVDQTKLLDLGVLQSVAVMIYRLPISV